MAKVEKPERKREKEDPKMEERKRERGRELGKEKGVTISGVAGEDEPDWHSSVSSDIPFLFLY